MSKQAKKWLGRGLWLLGLGFAGLNVVAFMQAWRLTHFSAEGGQHTPDPAKLGAGQKAWVLLTGISNPKPRNDTLPDFAYQTVPLPGPGGRLEAWYAPAPDSLRARGTVALFHGYASSKGRLRHEAATFRALGYAVLLVDEPGSGGSAGYRTSIGYYEAEAVASAVRYLRRRSPTGPLVLYGVSMGAVAIMRAEAELGVQATANILECPYGTMRQTVINRFRAMHAPVYPAADLLVLWGGLQNGFWAYGLRPEEYARRISTPTLLLWGTADKRVSRVETDSIYAHLAGPKRRVDFVGSGHQPYWHRSPGQWQRALADWLAAVAP